MEAVAETNSVNKRKRKQRERVSIAELYVAIEGMLPFAQIEIDCLASYVEDFPNDPDHAEDAERVRRGKEAIELARRLIARKTGYLRRKARAFMENGGPADA